MSAPGSTPTLILPPHTMAPWCTKGHQSPASTAACHLFNQTSVNLGGRARKEAVIGVPWLRVGGTPTLQLQPLPACFLPIQALSNPTPENSVSTWLQFSSFLPFSSYICRVDRMLGQNLDLNSHPFHPIFILLLVPYQGSLKRI